MAKPVQLPDGRKWGTRKEAFEHFKKMLAGYSDGARITDATDHGDLCALLTHYDRVIISGGVTKAGSGIEYFSRERNTGDSWSTSGFHVHRTDGTSIDFSFYEAVRS